MSIDDGRLAYVVDDEGAVRRSLSLLLRASGFEVRAFDSGEAFLDAAAGAEGLPFGCVLLDMRMPGLDGLAVQRRMAERGLRFPVVVVTAHGDVSLAVQAMKAGAADFIEKPYDDESILRSAEAALARGDEERARLRGAADASARIASLTPREREVLDGMVAGRANKEMAREFGLSHRTVEIHRANLMEKLGARRLSDVVRLALTAGLDGSGAPGPAERSGEPRR